MLIVPGRPAPDALTWWIYSDQGLPAQFRLDNAPLGAMPVVKLARDGDGASAQNIWLGATTGLAADSAHTLSAHDAKGSLLASADSRTVPRSLTTGKSFTVALGSCYCLATDSGLAKDHTPPLHDRTSGDPIRLRFLCGDQIYMDLSPASGLPVVAAAPDPWQRYPDQWMHSRFAPFWRASPTMVMADDHEFWNDYPHGNIWLALWDETDLGGKLGTTMDRAYDLFQAALNVEPASIAANQVNLATARTFALDAGGLSFFLLDTRTQRTRFDSGNPRFAPGAWLAQAIQWLRQLTGPGVLIVSQPMVEKPVSKFQKITHTMGDVNLPDYPAEFAQLWNAVFDAPHDVLIASGDIHWSRLYQVSRGGRDIFEVISSPLSIIPSPASDLGDDSGKVEWEGAGGLANWTKMFATASGHSYCTISFTPLADIRPSPVSVKVRWWAVDADINRGPNLIGERDIKILN